MRLYPQCHPYWIEDEKQTELKTIKVLTYTATGYVVPCCFVDTWDNKDYIDAGLFDEELKLENVSKVEDIILSKQWINFHKNLLEKPESAPSICKKNCSVKNLCLVDDE